GNPFFVNDQDVHAGAAHELSDGDILQIGGYVLRVRYADRQESENSLSTPRQPEQLPQTGVNQRTGLQPESAALPSDTRDDFIQTSNAIPLQSGPFDDLLGSPVVPPRNSVAPLTQTELTTGDLPPVACHEIPSDFNPFDAPNPHSAQASSGDPLTLQGISLAAVTPKVSPFSVVDQDPDIPLKQMFDLADAGNVGSIATGSDLLDPMQLFKDESAASSLLSGLGQPAHCEAKSVQMADELGAFFRVPEAVVQCPAEPVADALLDATVSSEVAPANMVADSPVEIASIPHANSVRENRDNTQHAEPVKRNEIDVPDQESGGGMAAPQSTTNPDDGASPTLVRGELRRAFEEGLQATLPQTDSEITPETMRLIGMLLRTSIGGTLDLMRARSLVKKEIRVQMTVIEPADNNPLKFSPDADVAVQYLFGKKYPGFLGPVDAMNSALTDLAVHQMGMVAGMRSALEGVVSRFDPTKIRTEVDKKRAMANLIPMSVRAAYWNEYCGRYQAIADALGEDFQDLYANAFARAYEEEIAGHSTQRGPL
ncbi:MAG: type VI secretion system-associated FHA domain protein TagH, partial [Georgfuchsia sp.]